MVTKHFTELTILSLSTFYCFSEILPRVFSMCLHSTGISGRKRRYAWRKQYTSIRSCVSVVEEYFDTSSRNSIQHSRSFANDRISDDSNMFLLSSGSSRCDPLIHVTEEVNFTSQKATPTHSQDQYSIRN